MHFALAKQGKFITDSINQLLENKGQQLLTGYYCINFIF